MASSWWYAGRKRGQDLSMVLAFVCFFYLQEKEMMY